MVPARHVLLVEDDYMQASVLADELVALGIDVVGPVGSVAGALECMAANQAIAGAILDINLDGEWSYPLASVLQRRSVPFVFWTGYGTLRVPAPLEDSPLLLKPASAADLLEALFQPQRTADGAELATAYRSPEGHCYLIFGAHRLEAADDALAWLGTGMLSRRSWSRMLRTPLKEGTFYRVPWRYGMTLRTKLDVMG